ncbi:MAG: magnesium transporter CorA family protein [Caulobacteraceae bacterium]
MLSLFPNPGDGDLSAGGVIWLDLLEPTEAEIAKVEKLIGRPLPTFDSLSEIEASSRLRETDGVLTMSMPTALHKSPDDPSVAPAGFVLSPERLVTIRYMALPAFDAVRKRLEAAHAQPSGGFEVFTELCEEIVDRIADILERIAEEIGRLSLAAFHTDDSEGRHAVRSNRLLRTQLRQVGQLGDRLSEARDSLVGLGRIVAFTEQVGCGAAEAKVKTRLAVLRQDLSSIGDYDEHLSNKVQFILDAIVGLIGIAQNDIFKVLTIVSIVGIPPTLVAGIYGMNFKNMPEYNWVFGYQYGLAMIALTTVLPLIWFKMKGWF